METRYRFTIPETRKVVTARVVESAGQYIGRIEGSLYCIIGDDCPTPKEAALSALSEWRQEFIET